MKEKINNIFKKREKLYYFLLFLVLSLVVISQVVMRMSGMMGYFSAIETFEGEFVTDDEMFNKAEITLEVRKGQSGEMLEIYLNGEKNGFLDERKKKMVIETDSVIEIFCPETPNDLEVTARCREPNVINLHKEYPIKLKKGFNVVARFNFSS